jgi:serine/threonine protein kinase/TM2 domain-containing membrane protein YozV
MNPTRHLLHFACCHLFGEAAGRVEQAACRWLVDHGRKLPNAIARAEDRSWKTLALALSGDQFLDRAARFFASADETAFRAQVKALLDSDQLNLGTTGEDARRRCLTDLNRFRQAGKARPAESSPAETARTLMLDLRARSEPLGLVDGALAAVGRIAEELAPEYPHLADLLRPSGGGRPPLLATAFVFFFRREVEQDEELARGLTFDQLRQLTTAHEAGFGAIGRGIAQLGDRFDEVSELLGRIELTAAATHGAVLDIQATLDRLAGSHTARQDEVVRLLAEVKDELARVGMQKGEVSPQHSLSIRGDAEKELVRGLLARYRNLPESQRREAPALLNGLGKLLIGTGDYRAAEATFAQVTTAVADNPAAVAEASFNEYRAAAEARDWDVALTALKRAAEADPARYEPFPLRRYEPKRVLGAGGFGTAFLCHDRNFDEEVVVKILHTGDLERSVKDVFREAVTLRRLSHPALIAVRDCEYADPARQQRPYLVMEYFPGDNLQRHVEEHGLIPVDQWLVIARQLATGMKAAHDQGVMHRDLKPANILVRNDGGSWTVKVIDFGLAVKRHTLETSRQRQTGGASMLGLSVAGTLKYAPPEQLGQAVGVPTGPYSDVFAFAKTCCFALFETTEPKRRHWEGVPSALADLLERCMEEEPKQRPADFAAVLSALDAANAIAAKTAPPPVPPSGVRRRQREDGEREFRDLVRQALVRTGGKPVPADSEAANELRQRHGIPSARAKELFAEVLADWRKTTLATAPAKPSSSIKRPAAPANEPVLEVLPVGPGRSAPKTGDNPAKGKRVLAGVLGILFGALGIHKFVLGLTAPGVTMLLISVLTCCYFAFIPGLIGLIEGIIYLTKSDADFERTYGIEKKGWF